MEMNMKMGDYIKTLIDKDAPWGSKRYMYQAVLSAWFAKFLKAMR